MTDKLLLRPEEAAERLGIGRTKLYELMAEGVIRSVHIGSCRRVPVTALDAYVAELVAAADAAQAGTPPARAWPG
jgi:excisionase family DNA binding protein